jgi:hypothetical protein
LNIAAINIDKLSGTGVAMCKLNRNNYRSNELGTDFRETIAKATHENYRHAKATSSLSQDPEMADWDKLRKDFKESNLQQADHILEKLRQIGCKVREARNIPIPLVTFTDNEIEIMAEMEHERWVKERLIEGWKPGTNRNADNKISPYLIPWSELPKEVKELDRRPVRKIPEFLASVGLEVYK